MLTGVIDERSVGELREHCRTLADTGWRRVVIDASAVSRCDRAGLSGLRALQDGSDLEVRPTGLRWGQFLALLQSTRLEELNGVHADIRVLRGESDLNTSRAVASAAKHRIGGRRPLPRVGTQG